MNILKHLVQQPFVASTGIAALVHSTWALGTLFSGKEPSQQFSASWFAWVIPAFLIAFALDVGQIATSAEIRAGHRNRRKYATFAVFALATYYLQWLYMAHHMPALELAAGVRETWSGTAQLIRDAAIWFIPALLPLSTLLYTFSQEDVQVHEVQSDAVQAPVIEVQHEQPALTEGDNALGVILFEAKCDVCGKLLGDQYKSQQSAERALRSHKSQFCEGIPVAEQYPDMVQFINEMHETTSKKSRSNGNAKLIME